MKLLRTLIFWPVTSSFTAFMCFKLYMVAFFYKHRGRVETNKLCHDIAGQWGRGIFSLVPGWNWIIEGQNHVNKLTKPVVIVANHQSAVDICALYALQIQFRWLSKAEVFRMPLIGPVMKLSGYIPVVRGDKQSQNQAFDASRQCLQDGISMVYFPEGSRSEDGKLKEFKPGAFRLSEMESVDILPVVIEGTHSMMAKNALTPNFATVTLKVLEPTRKIQGESTDDFVNRVRLSMKDALEETRVTNQKTTTYNSFERLRRKLRMTS